MRREVIATVTLLLTLTFAVPVNADPLFRGSSESLDFRCDLSGDAGFGFVVVELFSADFGDFISGNAEIWLPGSDPEDIPDLFPDFEGTQVEVVGDQVTATFPMVSFDIEDPFEPGDPFGDLILTGMIGGLIDEETSSDRIRSFNRWIEATFTFQVFSASADVSLDGVPFDASCSATRAQSEIRFTNPHASRVDFFDATINCVSVAETDGSILELTAGERNERAGEGHREGFVELWIFPADFEGFSFPPELLGVAELPGLSGNINVTVPLFDVPEDFFDRLDPFPGPGDEPVTEAHVAMTIEEGEVLSSTIVLTQHGRQKRVETELTVSGAVDLDDGRSFNLDECFASQFEAKGLFNQSQGPQEKGKPPVNDTPEGALPLALGQHANQDTKAASLQPEAPCTVFDDLNGESDEPIGKTIWYTVNGTGEPITVSTTGSQFDTIVGVYTPDGEGGFDQVACVDDVSDSKFSLQATVTFASEPGLTYFIQAGGFGLVEDADPRFSSLPEYGLLKIAVS